jgi:hypothetical protein
VPHVIVPPQLFDTSVPQPMPEHAVEDDAGVQHAPALHTWPDVHALEVVQVMVPPQPSLAVPVHAPAHAP